MSLFSCSPPTVDVKYVELRYLGFDDQPVTVEGWVESVWYPGSMLALEWYNADHPDSLDREEFGCARIVKLDRQTDWISIEKGTEPPALKEAKQ